MTSPYGSTPTNGPAPRGTEGTAFGQTIDAEAYYNAPVTETPAEAAEAIKDKVTEAPAESQADAVQDPVPALAELGGAYTPTDLEAEDTEGIELETLPAFKDMRRFLPSQRLKMQMDAAKVATSLPSHLKKGDDNAKLDFDTMTSEDLDTLTNLISTVEAMVIDNAADPEAMTNWLVEQNDALNAVMAAFNKLTSYMGN